MANNKLSILKTLYPTSDGFGITLIIIRKGFFSLRIVDTKTVDACDIIRDRLFLSQKLTSFQ
jgi:hypothetical protein